MVSICFLYCTDISCRPFLLSLLFLSFFQIKLQFEALNETGTKAAIIKTGLKNRKKKKKASNSALKSLYMKGWDDFSKNP